MPEQFFNPLEIPDAAADPAAPASGFVSIYGKNGRVFGQDSAGNVYDLTFLLTLATKAQAEAGTDNARYMTPLRTAQHADKRLGADKVLRSYVFNIDGEETVSWPDSWASPPRVALAAFSTAGGSRPVVANLISVSTTSIRIRLREIATLNIAFRQEDVHVIAHGVPA
ncbi:MAG: hypothetical protein NXI11_04040 [Proteobacteria bacterium]|nr:hypothetical protein [Pseudomonadota bacterium]